MVYSDYRLPAVVKSFGLTVLEANLFGSVPPVQPAPWLTELLGKSREFAFFSEKSRCEFIVAPLLMGCREHLQNRCSIYSGVQLDVYQARGLQGKCDFLLGKTPSSVLVQAPLLMVVEAKKKKIEVGIGQCASQMIGVRVFNDQEQKPVPQVFGCVTTGETWQFLRLENSELVVDSSRYYIQEIDKILGILVSILK